MNDWKQWLIAALFLGFTTVTGALWTNLAATVTALTVKVNEAQAVSAIRGEQVARMEVEIAELRRWMTRFEATLTRIEVAVSPPVRPAR